MATTVARLNAVIGVDIAPLEHGLDKAKAELGAVATAAESSGQRVASAFSRIDAGKIASVGAAMTVGITVPMAAAAGASIKMASDTAESLGKVQVVFGQSAKAVEAFASTAASSLGMSRGAALEAAGTFGNLLHTIGLSEKPAADMSKALVKLAVDLGSFNNISSDEALLKLRSGLMGEAEPLRSLGVFLTEANVKAKAMAMGLADANGELSEGAKVQARYALIMAQTTTAQGDFERTSGNLAGSQKKLQAAMADAGAELGRVLLPAATEATKALTGLLKGFADMPEPAKNLTLALGGIAFVAGPLVTTVGGLIRGVQSIGEVFGKATLAIAAKKLALDNETASLTANTAAWTRNAGAAAAARGGGMAGVGLGLGVATGVAVAANAAYGAGHTMKSAEAEKQAILANQDLSKGQREAMLRDVAFRHSVGSDADWATKATMSAYGAFNPGNPVTTPLGPKETAALNEAKAIIAAKEQQKLLAAAGPGSVGSATPAAAAAQDPKDLQKAADALFAVQVEAAQTLAAGSPEGQQARAEAARLIPILNQQQQATRARAEDLAKTAGDNAEKQAELFGVQREFWQREGQIIGLQRRAKDEETDEAKKAADAAEDLVQKQEKARKEWEAQIAQAKQARTALRQSIFSAQDMWMDVQVKGAEEDQRAQAAVYVKVPVLVSRANEILADLRSGQNTAQEYWEKVQQYWSVAGTITDLNVSAQREADTAAKRAADDQKKAADEQQKAQEDAQKRAADAGRRAQDLAGARVGLGEAQLRNVPGLNNQQRSAALVPLLIKQFEALMRPVSGEDELSNLQRLTSAEGAKTKVLEALGNSGQLSGGGRGRGRNRINPVEFALSELNRLGMAAARQGPVPGAPPVTDQRNITIVIPRGTSDEGVLSLVRRELTGQARAMGYVPGG